MIELGFRQGGARQQLMEEKMKVVQYDSLNRVIQMFISEALSARGHARVDYSHFKVGAAMGCSTSTRHIIASGCNDENEILKVVHAEEAARARLLMMLNPGELVCVDIVAVVLEAEIESQHALPCGYCRQLIRGVGNDNTAIYGAKLNAAGDIWQVEVTTLGELLPFSFGPNNLNR